MASFHRRITVVSGLKQLGTSWWVENQVRPLIGPVTELRKYYGSRLRDALKLALVAQGEQHVIVEAVLESRELDQLPLINAIQEVDDHLNGAIYEMTPRNRRDCEVVHRVIRLYGHPERCYEHFVREELISPNELTRGQFYAELAHCEPFEPNIECLYVNVSQRTKVDIERTRLEIAQFVVKGTLPDGSEMSRRFNEHEKYRREAKKLIGESSPSIRIPVISATRG